MVCFLTNPVVKEVLRWCFQHSRSYSWQYSGLQFQVDVLVKHNSTITFNNLLFELFFSGLYNLQHRLSCEGETSLIFHECQLLVICQWTDLHVFQKFLYALCVLLFLDEGLCNISCYVVHDVVMQRVHCHFIQSCCQSFQVYETIVGCVNRNILLYLRSLLAVPGEFHQTICMTKAIFEMCAVASFGWFNTVSDYDSSQCSCELQHFSFGFFMFLIFFFPCQSCSCREWTLFLSFIIFSSEVLGSAV